MPHLLSPSILLPCFLYPFVSSQPRHPSRSKSWPPVDGHLSSDLPGHFLMGPDHRNRLHCGKDPAPGIFLPIELCLEITLSLVLGLVKGSFRAHFLSSGLLVYAIKTHPVPQSLALDQHGWAGVSPAGTSRPPSASLYPILRLPLTFPWLFVIVLFPAESLWI